MKTDIGIKDDIYTFVKKSAIMATARGNLSKTGVRPKGSTAEDVVISIIANENGQLQSAKVNVNIYVADNILPNGQSQEDTIRLRTLSKVAADVLEVGRGDDFRFTLESQRIIESESTREHVINNKLNYKQLNEE